MVKPVAWMSPDSKFSTTEGKLFHIPLYTTPRELSDEEIENLRLKIQEIWGFSETAYIHLKDEINAEIRAILKKASEK